MKTTPRMMRALQMERETQPTTPLERDTAEFDYIERTAQEIMEVFQEQDPLQTVMALRLAAQKIYDTRCRDRPGSRSRADD